MTSVADPATTTRGLVLVHASRRLEHPERFAGADVESYVSHHVATRVRDARKDGRPFVAIVGEARDLRAAAEELAHGETALLGCSPDAPLTDVGPVVDLGRVNGNCFLHHARLGFDPAQSRLALLHQIWIGPRLTLRIDGRPAAAWSVFVGNGCFGPGTDERAPRASMNEHVLDVRILRAGGRGARLRLLWALVRASLPDSRVVERRTCPAITIDGRGRQPIDVTLDGDLVQLETPLRFESDADALQLVAFPD